VNFTDFFPNFLKTNWINHLHFFYSTRIFKPYPPAFRPWHHVGRPSVFFLGLPQVNHVILPPAATIWNGNLHLSAYAPMSRFGFKKLTGADRTTGNKPRQCSVSTFPDYRSSCAHPNQIMDRAALLQQPAPELHTPPTTTCNIVIDV
jgi:hypothetical protein